MSQSLLVNVKIIIVNHINIIEFLIIYYRRLREYQLYKIYLCVSIYSLYDAICINIYVPQTLYMRSQIVLGMSIMGIQANSLIKQNVIAAESHIPLTQPHSCYKKYVYALKYIQQMQQMYSNESRTTTTQLFLNEYHLKAMRFELHVTKNVADIKHTVYCT